MKVLFMGSPAFAVPSLDALHHSTHDILEVVTQPDRPRGRGRGMQPSDVGGRAAELGYSVQKPEKFGTRAFVEHLASHAPDAFVVVAYGKILRKRHLEIPRFGCINVHPSLLPRHRGAVPIQSALRAGDDVTGVTTMLMGRGLDTGDMLLQRAVPVEPAHNAGVLHDELSVLGAQMLVETLGRLEANDIQPTPQNDDDATECSRLTKEDGRLLWASDARTLYRHVRAMTPWPAAFTFLNGDRVTVKRAEVADVLPHQTPAGTITALDAKRGPIVACGTGHLVLTELQLAGKKSVSGDAFLRGGHIEPGARLGEGT